MKNQFYRPKLSFRERMIRFMSGRNGSDRLGRALLVVSVVLAVVNIIFKSIVLFLLVYAILGYTFFRMMSRNVYKRQKEDQWYCNLVNRVKAPFRIQKNKWRDRKTHVYHKCPHCKNVLRLPKIKGKHTVNCPCCHNKFDMKV